jgi:hypothetical protein
MWSRSTSGGRATSRLEISNGEESVLLGHQRSGGEVAAQFVDAASTGRRQDVPADADLGDGGITVRFPADIVGVALEWPVWKALIVVDGVEVASELCSAT